MKHDPNFPLYRGDAIKIDGDEFVVVRPADAPHNRDSWMICFLCDGEYHVERRHIDWFTQKLHHCESFELDRDRFCSNPMLDMEQDNLFLCHNCSNARVTKGVTDLERFLSNE